MKDLELIKEDLYHSYLEDWEDPYEYESLKEFHLADEYEQRLIDEERIYHIMWSEYFLSNGNIC